MFSLCYSLSFLPDISRWNTKNVILIDSIFNKCINVIKINNTLYKNINNHFNENLIHS